MNSSLPFFFLFILFASLSATAQNATKCFKKEYTLQLDYLLYLPPGYQDNPGHHWPLLVFLHGSGERGNNPELVKKHGPPKLIEEGRQFPFIVVSPQCPESSLWSADIVMALIFEIQKEYRIDKDRMYLTGLSLGGFGTWDIAARYPGVFAAIAPVCGGGDVQFVRFLRDLPVWAFHGALDEAVPVRRTEEMVDALKALGSDVRMTIYPDLGHDSWTRTYENDELYEWFLQHSLEQ